MAKVLAMNEFDYTGEQTSWQSKGACRGNSETFFAPDFERGDAKRRRQTAAKAICAVCPVRAQCLDYALSVDEKHGIWGGLTEDERVRLVSDNRRSENNVLSLRPTEAQEDIAVG